MFLFNIFSKKPPTEEEKSPPIILLDDKSELDRIKQYNPVLDKAMSVVLEEARSTSGHFDDGEAEIQLQRLFEDSKHTVPRTIFLTDIILPDSALKDFSSFKTFMATQFKGQNLNKFLSSYQRFEKLYDEAFSYFELLFNYKPVPRELLANGSDTPEERVIKKQKFNDFLTIQLGAKKQNFIENYKQHLFSMTNNLLMLAIASKGKTPTKNKFSINFVPEKKGIMVHTKTQPFYRLIEDPSAGPKPFSGFLSTQMMLTDKGSLKFTRITATSPEIAGVLLDREDFSQFDKLIQECDRMYKKTKRTTVKDACLYIKSKLISARSEADMGAISQYEGILKDFNDGPYRTKYDGFAKTRDHLYREIESLRNEALELLRPYNDKDKKAEGPEFEQIVGINKICADLEGQLWKFKTVFPPKKTFDQSYFPKLILIGEQLNDVKKSIKELKPAEEKALSSTPEPIRRKSRAGSR